ncbi:MAG: TRAP transporter substrate-binding protein [Gammaproteobacteria bacterium]|nr:TRAP transporter substrate-binding protein [Gammaproteobacteria bacterium]
MSSAGRLPIPTGRRRLRPPLAVAAALAALLVLGGCERPAGTIVTLGGTTTPGTPGEALWLEFRVGAESASAGAIHMRPLIYGQLGSEEQLLSGLRRGRIQYANLSAQVLSTVVPELTLLYTPYLFADEGEADYVYDRYLTGLYRGLLAARGIHFVTWYEIGFHDVYAREPLILPDDAKGRRFRIASSLNARLFAEAIGADVIPLGFGDIVPALQTGLIDAGENSVTLYSRTGIAGQAPHLTLTNHVLGISLIVSQRAWWDSLPESQRRILTESFPPVERSRAVVRAQTAGDLANAEELGIVVHRLSPEELEAWRQATADVSGKLLGEIGGRSREIHARVITLRDEYRAGRATGAQGSPASVGLAMRPPVSPASGPSSVVGAGAGRG